jgi:ATP-dependent helicase Lhr and Lhr-like helicase
MASAVSDSEGAEANASAFARLHPGLQRWIWEQKWGELRPSQVEALGPILNGRTDVIISAATASGKTEAAFLPMLSAVAALSATTPGVEILYVSPLKALINDQFDRISDLAGRVEVAVHRWHGDVAGNRKAALMSKPTGVLLITPESLEALFVLRGTQVPTLFGALRYVLVDELHSFIGTERGAQLQSLLHRCELAIRRRVPRIALSATLGDMASAAEFLRPGAGAAVREIIDEDSVQALKLQVRGYTTTDPSLPEATGQSDENQAQVAIAQHLFDTLRGSDNLIFANERVNVEVYADLLARRCETLRVPNEFFAHHGSLSKELREFVESRLKDRSQPANAVCTSTLEMGIDIGDVRSIAQIGAPPAVSSMRQRLGRSGRRGEAAVLRVYISEEEVTASTPPPDALRPQLVQTVAMVNLLLRRWYEPSVVEDLHLSALIQQLLSLIAQHGGVLAAEAFSALCGDGPFGRVVESQFADLLRHLGSADILVQAPDGILLLGGAGERIVNHYSFYAAFKSVEEWRMVHEGRALGTMPVNFSLAPGRFLIFAGRRWRVTGVDVEHKVVDLVPAPGGKPPLFKGTGVPVHDQVRAEMLEVYSQGEVPAYLDAKAADLLSEGRANFARLRLNERRLLESGSDTYVFLWAGDRIVNTVVAILSATELRTTPDGLALSVAGVTPVELAAQIMAIMVGEQPHAIDLALTVANKAVEKYDGLVPEPLLSAAYAARNLDIPGAWRTLQEVVDSATGERQ